MAVLEVKNLKKNFGSTDVLKGVSFSLEQGQVLTIIGSSGSGKTTLLRCLNFLETPDEGEILVGGKVLTSGNDEEIRQNRLHFGLVFQNFNLLEKFILILWLTNKKNQLFVKLAIRFAKKCKIPDGESERKFLKLIERINIDNRLNPLNHCIKSVTSGW